MPRCTWLITAYSCTSKQSEQNDQNWYIAAVVCLLCVSRCAGVYIVCQLTADRHAINQPLDSRFWNSLTTTSESPVVILGDVLWLRFLKPVWCRCTRTQNTASSTAASLQPMRSVASGSAQQVAISSSCHDIVAPISAVGRLLWQTWLPGTRCQTISAIRR